MHLKEALLRKTAFDRNAAMRAQMMELQRQAAAKKQQEAQQRQLNQQRMQRGQKLVGSREVTGGIDTANAANQTPVNVGTSDYSNPRGNTLVSRDYSQRQELQNRPRRYYK